jgi:hypothetical protein
MAGEKKIVLMRIQRQVDSLKRLKQSLADPAPGQHRDAVRRVAVEGRALTNIVENLRNKAPNFDQWYQAKVIEMQSDELLRFFYKLRSEVLKQGDDKVVGVQMKPIGVASLSPTGITVEWVDANGQKFQMHHPRPDNCVSSFMGDVEGGTGFIVRLPDGREVKQYVYLPPEVADITVLFDRPPRQHLGQPIPDVSAKSLCYLYLDYIIALGEEAVRVFAD